MIRLSPYSDRCKDKSVLEMQNSMQLLLQQVKWPRLMGSGGGVEGMAKKIARQIAFSGNIPAFCDAINEVHS